MEKKFILGHGERLISDLKAPRISPNKRHPYDDPDEVYARLLPEYTITKNTIQNLENRFCPRDEAVFCIDLHPAYLSKSYFPDRLLGKLELRPVGSRLIKLTPSISTKKKSITERVSYRAFCSWKKAKS